MKSIHLFNFFILGFAGADPIKKLDYGTFKGKIDLNTMTDNFLGMPFAVAGRFENPRVIGAQDKLKGVQDATRYGASCPQQELIASPLNSSNAQIGELLNFVEQLGFRNISNQAEDCLFVNVQLPKNAKKGDKLPVFMWIYGGGFELGSSSAIGAESTAINGIVYQGANLVARSVEMRQPIVFVSANHRLNAFGTLASKETKEANIGNLLLKDQRTAMRWVKKYINEFGGDPDRVTLFGESAGSLAIATHMLLNDGDTEGLFHGAIMLSGGVMRLESYHRSQHWFDQIVNAVDCGSSKHKISCLKQTKYENLYSAVQQLPNFFSYDSTLVPWYPRPDGEYLQASPHQLLETGKIANIPYIIGDMKDEGTLFSLVNQASVTTDDDFVDYFHNLFFPNISRDKVKALTALYSQDPAKGSPFDTGDLNEISPQYKRLAALTGDITFQSGRRNLLRHTSSKQHAWTYLAEQSVPILGQLPLVGPSVLTSLPILGSFHVSDVLLNVFGNIPASVSKNTLNFQSTFISFVNHQDPNKHGLDLPFWPRYDTKNRSMFRFRENSPDIIQDTFRAEAMNWLNDHGDWYRN